MTDETAPFMFCPRCSAKYAMGVVYCPKCGIPAVPLGTVPSAPPKEKRRVETEAERNFYLDEKGMFGVLRFLATVLVFLGWVLLLFALFSFLAIFTLTTKQLLGFSAAFVFFICLSTSGFALLVNGYLLQLLLNIRDHLVQQNWLSRKIVRLLLDD
jgi:hypothetical protein